MKFKLSGLARFGIILLLGGLFLGLSYKVVQSSNNQWTILGSMGEGWGEDHPLNLAIDPTTPTTLYAGTRGDGMWKSIDGGTSWLAINNGLTGIWTQDVLLDPATPTTLYVSTGSVSKSTNGGTTWSTISNGLPDSTANTLVMDPTASTTLYAGMSGRGSDIGGIYKSINGGASWSAINNGLPNVADIDVTALAIDPTTPTTLYAGTNEKGIYRSTNGGSSWSVINNGLPGDLTYLNVSVFAIDPLTPTIIYAGMLDYGEGGGIYKSTNGGSSWSTNGLDNFNVFELVIDPTTPTTLYAGAVLYTGQDSDVFKSTNGGGSWSTNGLKGKEVRSLIFDPTFTSLYAGTYGDGAFTTNLSNMTINHATGSPGSFLTLTGAKFPPSSTATIKVNGHVFTDTVSVDSEGNFTFLFDTSLAESGSYFATASVNPSATVNFKLDLGAPLRSQEGTGPVLTLPGGIAFTEYVYLPLIQK